MYECYKDSDEEKLKNNITVFYTQAVSNNYHRRVYSLEINTLVRRGLIITPQ